MIKGLWDHEILLTKAISMLGNREWSDLVRVAVDRIGHTPTCVGLVLAEAEGGFGM